MKEGTTEMLQILQTAFESEDIKTESYKDGFFGNKITKFIVPEQNIKNAAKQFPFLKHAVKAGLLQQDKRKGAFFTTSKILEVKATDKRKMGEKQFFSITGDKNDRTTLKDALISIENIKTLAEKFNINPKDIKFSIQHKNGNPDEVVNFMEVDPRIFGKNREEVEKSLDKINNVIKFER